MGEIGGDEEIEGRLEMSSGEIGDEFGGDWRWFGGDWR